METRESVAASARVAALLLVAALSAPAAAVELLDGRVELHGALSHEIHSLSDGFRVRNGNWFLSQMATTFSTEIEAELLPEGWGPINLLEAFVRLEVRYDCVWSDACHLAPQWNLFGDDVERRPENWANGRTNGVVGYTPDPRNPPRRVQPNRRLLNFAEVTPTDRLLQLATPSAFEETFERILPARFTTRHYQGSFTPLVWGMGPLNPGFDIDATGVLEGLSLPDAQVEPPLRPKAEDLYIPSAALRRRLGDFDNFDQNFTENELEWNRGASQQQTKELKEAYLDVTLLDGQMILRLGKQAIVWGKTELFRAQDQWNPQDLAMANLPPFEESRIALWSARGIYSFYDVGPFEDLRLEVAVNLDHFEPADTGKCGEPYTVFLVCGLSRGLFEHGWSAIGIAGAERPDDWWDRGSGLEFGARVEFRLGRFSVAITDFYGYNDFPTADFFHEFERNVDPGSGRPRIEGGSGPCVLGDEAACLTPGNALDWHSGNRQLFDTVCSATLGFEIAGSFGGFLGDALDSSCALTLFGNPAELLFGLTIPLLASAALSGDPNWDTLADAICIGGLMEPVGCISASATTLSRDANDDYLATLPGSLNDEFLSAALTVQQEALLGCGPYFYGADDGQALAAAAGVVDPLDYDGSCTRLGLGLFNAEASVLFQRFPQTGAVSPFDLPVGTRFLPGVGQIVLPGSRSPFRFFEDPVGYRYDPAVDGCVADLDWIYSPAEAATIPNKSLCDAPSVASGGSEPLGEGNGTFMALVLRDDFGEPIPGRTLDRDDIDEIRMRFPSEMSVVSENFLKLLVAVAQLTDVDGTSGCSYGDPDSLGDADSILRCDFVNGLFESAGMQRPERRAGGNRRYGRLDFAWHGGSEIALFHERRNVFGVAMDFSEDLTRSTWSLEFTWFEDEPYTNYRTDRGFSREDTLNLTVSVDRPTFVNFLNANRSIFINAQLFARYIPRYRRLGTFDVDGPISLLGTATFLTGFYQDRLMTQLTLLHELESNSGGQIFEAMYRFSSEFSVTVGVHNFYGAPRRQRVPDRPPVNRMHAGDWNQRFSFQGVSALSQRDEIFVRLRYTY